MKLVRFSVMAAIAIALSVLTACEGPDSKQMQPYKGGGMDSSLEGGPGSGTDLSSGFGSGAGSLPGRPGEPWQPIPGKEHILAPVYFAFDQSDIEASQTQAIEAVSKYMQNNPAEGVIVQGNCDERGSAEYNMGLGERRSLSAREYLVKLGIPETRLQTISYGNEKPADPGHGEAAWAKNRRDEFVPAKMN